MVEMVDTRTMPTPEATMTPDGKATGTHEEPTGWVGWIVFASVAMVIGGALEAFYGIVAVINDEWVVWGNRGALYLDLTTWGWVHLIVGTVVFFSGLGVLRGSLVARTVGVVVASLSLMANFMFIPAYPLWTITIIAIDMLVIWALTVHGGEMGTS